VSLCGCVLWFCGGCGSVAVSGCVLWEILRLCGGWVLCLCVDDVAVRLRGCAVA